MNEHETLNLLTAAGACVVFIVGVLKYVDTRNKEFRQAFWQKQFDVFVRATRAAAKIAIAPDIESVKSERQEFWSLYWGELSILENEDVRKAMVAYGDRLKPIEGGNGNIDDLKDLSYNLARACRESLKKTWEPVPLDDVHQKKP
jgi:hypothetical protein